MDSMREVVRGELGKMKRDLAVLVADDCLVRPGQVKMLLGCSEPIANNIRKRSDFPRLRELAPGTFGYVKSEIIAWLRSAESTASPLADNGRSA